MIISFINGQTNNLIKLSFFDLFNTLFLIINIVIGIINQVVFNFVLMFMIITLMTIYY
ncbi:hypothetical protein [Spiroplasma turonicum]|uniref:hypothetical protein n=1 Tax=Spiroplasma turonicum TaxID=216946 RepID=UPI00130E10E3|nr:hypothetical protein [Spiroplasma turonicum]